MLVRDLYNYLLKWRSDSLRMPLILRGARQVGKSWLVNQFGKTFDCYIELNFDWDEGASSLFDGNLEIHHIVENIQFYANKRIVPGKTLIFFDEIQECPRALKTLRYFKEKMPELHVIAAGSLLDFTLEKIGVPVGRVQFLYLYPLSFVEFLNANQRSDLREYIETNKTIEPAIHKILLELLKTYMWLGGMPAVVDAWLRTRDPIGCQSLQDRLISAYRQDFQKYAKKTQIDNVDKVFASVQQQLGKKFKYSDVDPEVKSHSLKNALSLLIKAGVAYPCYHTSAQGLPLAAGMNEKRFKVFFFDIGLAQRMAGLSLKNWVISPLDVKYLGAVTEQLIAQEYIAYLNPEKNPELYYWHRETSASNAEIDFIFEKMGNIIPVEVKAAVKGGMKSLKSYQQSHPNTPYGLKISQNIKAEHGDVKEISLYALRAWLVQPFSMGI